MKLRVRLSKYAHSMTEASSQSEPAGPSSRPTLSTSEAIPDPSSKKPEAMDTGALVRALELPSLGRPLRDPWRWTTLRLLRVDLCTQDWPKVKQTMGYILRLVRNAHPRRGRPPPQGKTKKKVIFIPANQTFHQAEADNLLGVLLIQGHPYTVLSRVQLDHVHELLLQGNWLRQHEYSPV